IIRVIMDKPKSHIEKLPSGLSFEMIFVEGGTFMMGSDSEEAYDREKPVHEVALDSFYLGKYPVTQALWKSVMGNNPSEFQGENNPVEKVSWYDTQDFLKKLNELIRKEYRLPSEAEWEFAARGGNQSEGYKYSGSDRLCEVGWYNENSESSHPVGEKLANELEIFDMSGNVFEWCQDWYRSDYYRDCFSKGIVENPKGAVLGECPVIRGGSWHSDTRECRSSCRSGHAPEDLFYLFGFRLALSFQLTGRPDGFH
ncbi:MAG: formylglycine-generating enzyme family protein, partial [Bacteroidetes bacterium]|nr:formylglycine-generating enzyme family protein [Bacteroidota bacterium]